MLPAPGGPQIDPDGSPLGHYPNVVDQPTSLATAI